MWQVIPSSAITTEVLDRIPYIVHDLLRQKTGYVASIAGGFPAEMLRKARLGHVVEASNDIDIFVEASQSDAFISDLRHHGGARVINSSTWATTLEVMEGYRPVQVVPVVGYTGDLSELFNTFDLTVCQVGLNFETGRIESTLPASMAAGDEDDVELIKENVNLPLLTSRRILKYARKGYRMDLAQKELIKHIVSNFSFAQVFAEQEGYFGKGTIEIKKTDPIF